MACFGLAVVDRFYMRSELRLSLSQSPSILLETNDLLYVQSFFFFFVCGSDLTLCGLNLLIPRQIFAVVMGWCHEEQIRCYKPRFEATIRSG